MHDVFQYKDEHITVAPVTAKVIGLNEAIILYKFNYLIKINRDYECFCKFNTVWIRCSVSELNKLYFPFWSISTLKRTLYRLARKGLIRIGRLNEDNIDTTNWYTVNYDAVEVCIKSVSLDSIILDDNKLVQFETTECEDSISKELENFDLHEITTNKLCSLNEENLNELFNELDLVFL